MQRDGFRAAAPRRLLAALALAAAAGWCACGSGESAPASPPEPAAAPAAPPAPAAPAPEPTAPVAKSGPDAIAGEGLYQTYCASCHGTRGAGDGPAAAALDPKPAHHDDGQYMNPKSNEYLFQVISEGGASVGKSPLMAPWGGSLDEGQIWDVIAYVRTLAKPPYEGKVP